MYMHIFITVNTHLIKHKCCGAEIALINVTRGSRRTVSTWSTTSHAFCFNSQTTILYTVLAWAPIRLSLIHI